MAPPTINGQFNVVGSQSSTFRLKMYWIDDSSSSIVVPTSPTFVLYDVNDVARNPTNTALVGSAVIPTTDIDNGLYIDVTADAAAALGTWYVAVSGTHEGIPRTQYLTFPMVAAGASASGGTNLYCSVNDVVRFLFRNVSEIDANTLLSKTDMEDIIRQEMDIVDAWVRTTWQTKTYTDEFADINYSNKWRWSGDYVVLVHTTHRPLRSIVKIEVAQGGRYIDITAAEDRTQTYYSDRRTGEILLVGTNMPSTIRKGARLTYTAGESTPVPGTIKEATILLTAAYVMESEMYAVDLPGGEGTDVGSVAQMSERWRKRANEIMEREMRMVYSAHGG